MLITATTRKGNVLIYENGEWLLNDAPLARKTTENFDSIRGVEYGYEVTRPGRFYNFVFSDILELVNTVMSDELRAYDAIDAGVFISVDIRSDQVIAHLETESGWVPFRWAEVKQRNGENVYITAAGKKKVEFLDFAALVEHWMNEVR